MPGVPGAEDVELVIVNTAGSPLPPEFDWGVRHQEQRQNKTFASNRCSDLRTYFLFEPEICYLQLLLEIESKDKTARVTSLVDVMKIGIEMPETGGCLFDKYFLTLGSELKMTLFQFL